MMLEHLQFIPTTPYRITVHRMHEVVSEGATLANRFDSGLISASQNRTSAKAKVGTAAPWDDRQRSR